MVNKDELKKQLGNISLISINYLLEYYIRKRIVVNF